MNMQAVFGGGCFWCYEAIFRRLRGVEFVVSGYAGGETKNPTYDEVCTGATGHAEVIKIIFDPAVISYEVLLEIFFHVHDPTVRNRQGADTGSQYRSLILYQTEAQKDAAERIIKKLTDEHAFENPIVTEIKPLGEFCEAEAHHQRYYDSNPEQAYCQYVITPKLAKFIKQYSAMLV